MAVQLFAIECPRRSVMEIEFLKADPSQADALSDLAIESKGHWGYSRAQLDLWRKDLRIEEEYIRSHVVETILFGCRIVGFFSIKNEEDECLLDDLWLLSAVIGKGVGNLAFRRIEEVCSELGIKEFTIISDPNAEGFYLKQGARRVGELESVPQNRMLPRLKYQMKESIQNQTVDTTPVNALR